MGGSKKRKCRNCGQLFDPKGPGDFFCSSLCRTTGKFLGGGGDTTKPMSAEQRKDMIRRGKAIPTSGQEPPKPRKIRNGSIKFPRVMEMFSQPLNKRWAIAKHFTPQEQDFARRMAKRQLMEERKMDSFIDWDGGYYESELDSADDMVFDRLGESDDGTV